jgi:hypothetical protein
MCKPCYACSVNSKQFQKYLDRDDGCVHCGQTESVSPHHRLNRGMGGSKVRDVPSNIIVICSDLNARMESDPATASMAKQRGWKLSSGANPASVAVQHYSGSWRILDDKFGFVNVAGVD